MPIFKSTNPPIHMPWHLSIWEWLFDSAYSPLENFPGPEIGGYVNAITKEKLTYWDVKKWTTYLSTALKKKYGLKEGETVALFSPNTVWYPVAMLGTLRAGGVVSGASPAYNAEEMTYALKVAQAKFLFTVPGSMEIAMTAAKNAGIPKERVFLLEGEHKGHTTMQELLKIGQGYGDDGQIDYFKIPQGKKNKDVCGFLSFSSGTVRISMQALEHHAACCLPLVMSELHENLKLTIDTDRSTKSRHDRTRQCDRAMPPNPPDFPHHTPQDSRCPASLPHYGPGPPTPSPRPPQRHRVHAPGLHDGQHATNGPRQQTRRDAPRPAHHHPHGARPEDPQKVRPLLPETLLLRRRPLSAEILQLLERPSPAQASNRATA